MAYEEQLELVKQHLETTKDALLTEAEKLWELSEPARGTLIAAWNKYLQGGAELWNDLLSIEPGSVPVTASGAGLVAVLVGLLTLVVYANWDRKPVRHVSRNAALGAGSEVVQNPDAPPIPPPTEIVALRIYPIKSCRGFEIEQTRLRKSGLTLDRNWMFIDAEKKSFLTIRSDPNMTLIDTKLVDGDAKSSDPSLRNDQLEISIHGKGAGSTVRIPAHPSRSWLEDNTTLSTVEIWEEDTDGYIYGDDVNKPFSTFFGKPVQLVYKGPTVRPNVINGFHTMYGKEVPHHFADVVSVQIASEASLKDLNAKLGHRENSRSALTIERFRPNIIVRGRDDHPWEEDTWKRVRISTTLPEVEALYKLDVDVVARCARCQVPNVHPDTAKKDAKEPWTTLMQFRRVDEGGAAKYKPCFGMLCIPKNEGIVKVGATLEVLETTSKHLYNTRAFKDL